MVSSWLFFTMSRCLLFCCLLLSIPQITLAVSLSGEPLVTNPLGTVLSTQQGLKQDSIQDLLIDNDNFLWVATDGGLDRFDGHRVEHITGENDLLASTPIQNLFLDSRNRLWISTYYRGLYRLDWPPMSFGSWSSCHN